MTTVLHVAALLLLAGVLASSGLLKLADPEGSVEAASGFGVPQALARPVSLGLSLLEVALAVLLLAGSGRLLVGAAAASLLLLLGFTVLVAVAVARGRRPACHCFGRASVEPVGRGTVVRDLVLVGLAAVVLLGAPGSAGLATTLATLGATEGALAVLLAASTGAAVVLVSRLLALRRTVAALRADLEEAAHRPERAEPVPVPEVTALDAAGAPVPLGTLSTDRAQLLVVVAPGCSACHDLVPVLPQWREALAAEVDVVLLSRSGPSEAVASWAEHRPHLLADPDGTVAAALGVAGTPAAVLLGTNGLVVAGPALGADEIVELVTAVVQAIGVNLMTGIAHQSAAPHALGGADHGDAYLPEPGTRLADVPVADGTGARTTLGPALEALRPADHDDVAVLAWSTGCAYCAEVLEPVRALSTRHELVLVVDEPVEAVRAQGLDGPVLRVLDGAAPAALGLVGTPAGFPVRDLVVRPGGGVGGGSVLRMLRERAVAHGVITAEEATHPALGGSPLP